MSRLECRLVVKAHARTTSQLPWAFYSSSRCRPTCLMSRTNFTLRGRGSFLGSELTYGDIYNDREIVRFCPKAHE